MYDEIFSSYNHYIIIDVCQLSILSRVSYSFLNIDYTSFPQLLYVGFNTITHNHINVRILFTEAAGLEMRFASRHQILGKFLWRMIQCTGQVYLVYP